MKAKEYAEKMAVEEQVKAERGLAYLLVALTKEIRVMTDSRNCTTLKSLASIVKEISKKYVAVQKIVPQFWESSDNFKNASFVDMMKVIAPELGKVYQKALDFRETKRRRR